MKWLVVHKTGRGNRLIPLVFDTRDAAEAFAETLPGDAFVAETKVGDPDERSDSSEVRVP